MTTQPIDYYIVDVFAANKYEGNQLAVFVCLAKLLTDKQMQQIAREINFAETTFITADKGNNRFGVRIFTPEHEVPFAGHPTIGTGYVIARFLLPNVPDKLVLELAKSNITVTINDPVSVDTSVLFMQQAQPEFREQFVPAEIAEELGIKLDQLGSSLPIQEISTGLPYILIPLANLAAMGSLSVDYDTLKRFLFARKKYRTNSPNGHSTSLFFFTSETYESGSGFNARMILLENGRVSEDAATGSANGCLLAYLLRYVAPAIEATVEQGFQMGRRSYLFLNGSVSSNTYQINVGGRTQLVSQGIWYA